MALLELDGVGKDFALRGGRTLHAVQDVSLSVEPGETLGLVGESGCGKSTLARCIVGLHRPTAGSVRFDGEPVGAGRRSRAVRRDLTMVFQDPVASLNPRRRVARHRRRPARHPRSRTRRRAAPARARHARARRPRPRPRGPLSARVLRRPAPAHRYRPRPDHASAPRRLRRAGLGARRLDPGADPQPPGLAARRARPHARVHRARPRRRAPRLAARRRDVPRADRRDQRRGRAVRGAAAPVHGGPAGRRARARHVRAPVRRGDPRRRRAAPSAAPPAARSIRAARAPASAAWPIGRRSRRRRPATSRPVTTRSACARDGPSPATRGRRHGSRRLRRTREIGLDLARRSCLGARGGRSRGHSGRWPLRPCGQPGLRAHGRRAARGHRARGQQGAHRRLWETPREFQRSTQPGASTGASTRPPAGGSSSTRAASRACRRSLVGPWG